MLGEIMFTRIDLKNYYRAEQFNHFMNNVPCVYNITANINITRLIATLKANDVKLYPSLIFILSKAVNQIEEMRLGFNEEKELGYYDISHPSYTISNAVEGSFSGIWDYSKERFSDFYKDYLLSIKAYNLATTYCPKPNQPQNTFYVSCTPDIAFTSLSTNLYNGSQNITPMFTFGKYFNLGEQTYIPLAACLHHAACDGFHASKLYKIVQQLADNVSEWL